MEPELKFALIFFCVALGLAMFVLFAAWVATKRAIGERKGRHKNK